MRRKQNRSAEAVWRDRLARFGSSNLSVSQFCRKEGVSAPSFYHWRKRLQEQQEVKRVRRSGDGLPKAIKSQTFLPVSVPASMFAEVEFPNGVRIRVPAANAEALRVAITTGNEACREVR